MAFENLLLLILSLVLGSSLLASIVGPTLTRWYRIRSERERAKEEQFFDVLSNTSGFLKGTSDKNKRQRFYEAYRHLWLYASDETIESINKFFEAWIGKSNLGKGGSDADRAQRQMILQLRKDIHGETKLKPEDYLLLAP